MKNKHMAAEIASNRMQLVAPLLQECLDASEARQLRQQISAQTGLSDRTLRRYLDRYRKRGLDGLAPQPRGKKQCASSVSDNLLEQAILLRREVPGRSISTIIQILEMEGLAAPGKIKRTTLQEKFMEQGYSARQMRLYQSSRTASRRFQMVSRNDLWHSDIKYGPTVGVGPNKERKQVYLVAFLDDATRYVLHAAFYPSLDQAIVEDCFRQSIAKHGVPSAVYFDNGKQFRCKWMARACSKMGIRLLYAAPYSPEGTGKIERFNRTVDNFLQEQKLEKNSTLESLNRNLTIWMEECYQTHPHSGLKHQKSPLFAYEQDPKPLKFLDPEQIRDAFLHCEERVVDKVGCISFASKKYEAGLQFARLKVNIVYDLADTSVLTVEHPDHPPRQARQLVIGTHTGPKPTLPKRMTIAPAESSRLLAAATRKHAERKHKQHAAVSYRNLGGV